ncbi:putative lipoprotein [Leptospira weilii str. UI 13098]|uniref:Putative lipoprotein n=1 Tax=Leptospira weilii str. UI 13098 TaxID=1088542 RepID=M6Q5S3_9LEPT|nr:putative lipoprotein [Leptospira weilii str. UI 13098]
MDCRRVILNFILKDKILINIVTGFFICGCRKCKIRFRWD